MAYKVAKVGEGTIYAMPCPAAGQLEAILVGLKEDGVDRIVSLLELSEADKLGVGEEAGVCQELGLSYQNYPIKDFSTAQNQQKFVGLVDGLYSLLLGGESIVVHCYAGIGRTGLVLGSILIRHGVPAKEAIDLMSEARGRNMPQTQEQYEYLIDFEKKEGTGSGLETGVGSQLPKKSSWLTRWIG